MANNRCINYLFATYLALAPVSAAAPNQLESLIQESKARQIQMSRSIKHNPGCVDSQKTQTLNPPKASPITQQVAKGSDSTQPPALDAQLSFTPSTEENVETYTLGPMKYLNVFDSNSGARTAKFAYVQINDNLSLYGSQYPGGSWHFGPSITVPTSEKTSVSIDFAFKDANLFFKCGDGTFLGPVSLRDPKFRDLELTHMAWHYGAKSAISAIAGKDATQAAEKAYTVYRFASHPTPFGWIISSYNSIQANKHGRGSIQKYAKMAFDAATLGLFR